MVLNDALQLPDRERGEVAVRLLESFDAGADPDAEAAWAAEVATRLDDVRSGRVTPVPWAEARRQILADTDDDVG
jgi:putative addiction module component (TIGR02574 family)